MAELTQQHCEPCRVGAPTVPRAEQQALLSTLIGWQIVDKKSVQQLLKVYDFADFLSALEFANKVAELAEAEGHHPALLIEWGRVTVRWWTHKIKGLHQNDFLMAAKTDAL